MLIFTGFHTADLDAVKRKSEMKKGYRKAGVKTARFHLVGNWDGCKAFIREVGDPVVVRPDTGEGASNTEKLTGDEELAAFFASKPDVQFIMEEFVPGHVETFDGITDRDGNILFCAGQVMMQTPMEMLHGSGENVSFSQNVQQEDLFFAGRRVVAAFCPRNRFFHFEFFRLDEDKEILRIDEEGFLAHTPNPFPNEKHIVRDFCENQTEINTPVMKSAAEAVQALTEYDCRIQRTLKHLPKREYLWPFSNPTYIRNEEDIPVARFYGEEASKTEYREYLSDRYGRYKMTFSGIHVNFSFDETLLREDFALSGEADFDEYRNQLYVVLAEKAAAYGWLLVAVTAASPLPDSSFVEKGKFDTDTFNGLASTRCSELGYWNYFAPIFDYSNIRAYADSIHTPGGTFRKRSGPGCAELQECGPL